MRPWTIDRSEDARPHRVYDLTISDIEQRQQQSQVFRTATQTAQFLGMPSNKISFWRERGKKYFSDKHNKEFAIRMEKLK